MFLLREESPDLFKKLPTPCGIYRFFIDDTGGAESTTSKIDLLSFDSLSQIRLNSRTISYATGRSLPIPGSCLIHTRKSDSSPINCAFLISGSSPSIIGLNVFRKLRVHVSLLTVQHEVSDVFDDESYS